MGMLARSMGTRPDDLPPVERMYECEARTCESERPTPPAEREMSAHCRSESKIPSMESSAHVRRKHEAWGGEWRHPRLVGRPEASC